MAINHKGHNSTAKRVEFEYAIQEQTERNKNSRQRARAHEDPSSFYVLCACFFVASSHRIYFLNKFYDVEALRNLIPKIT